MANELFNKALKAHQSGDLNSAERLYKKFLKSAPREFNALQLLGVVLHAKGDDETALKYMLSSLKIKPNQPQVILNVASCQRKLKQYDAALKTLQQLISKDPGNFAAFRSRIYVLVEMKNYDRAYNELDRKISKFPDHYELFNLLGAVSSECHDYPKAISAYEKAVSIRPGSDVSRHNLGLAYRLNGESEKALKEYLIVLNSGKHSYQLMHNLGNAYSDIGHFEQAITFYQNALKLNYRYIDTHINLNDVLWEMGDKKNYLRSFQKAIEMYPHDSGFMFHYVRRLSRISQFALMKQCLDSCKKRFSKEPEFHYLYGKALIKLGQKAEGLSSLKGLFNNPQLATEDHLDICEICIKEGHFLEAESAISQILRVQPNNVAALAYWGLCLRHNQDTKELELNDYDNLVKEFKVFDVDNEPRFYKELIDTLTKLHLSKEQPIDQTLVNGTQTRGNLFSLDKPVIQELVEKIRLCINSYIDSVGANQHPWHKLPERKTIRFTGSWSVRLRDGGYHANHFHPMGKISSVLYISLPKTVASSKSKEGYLKFGEPNFDSSGKFQAQRLVRPEVGKLVLFPSYCWHGTETFSDDDYRLTVAFDVT